MNSPERPGLQPRQRNTKAKRRLQDPALNRAASNRALLDSYPTLESCAESSDPKKGQLGYLHRSHPVKHSRLVQAAVDDIVTCRFRALDEEKGANMKRRLAFRLFTFSVTTLRSHGTKYDQAAFISSIAKVAGENLTQRQAKRITSTGWRWSALVKECENEIGILGLIRLHTCWEKATMQVARGAIKHLWRTTTLVGDARSHRSVMSAAIESIQQSEYFARIAEHMKSVPRQASTNGSWGTLETMLCNLGGATIHLDTIRRGIEPARRWGDNGEPELQAPLLPEDDDIFLIFQDKARLSTELLKLHKSGFLTAEPPNLEMHTIIVDLESASTVRRDSPDQTLVNACSQACLLLCHAFPHDKQLESSFGEVGNRLLSAVRALFAGDRTIHRLNTGLRQHVAELLVVSSYFGETGWKAQALDLAITLSPIGSSTELQASSRQFFLKLPAKRCDIPTNPMTPKMHALTLHYKVALAKSLVRSEALTEALVMLQNSCRDQNSTMQRQASHHVTSNIAQILRFQGRFYEALEVCDLGMTDEWMDPARFEVSANSAETLYELGRHRETLAVLFHALPLCDTSGLQTRLMTLLAEVQLVLYYHDEARATLHTLSQRPSPNLFRMCQHICGAKLAHHSKQWNEATRLWKDAREILQQYNFGSGHASAILQLSLAYALEQGGNAKERDDIINTLRAAPVLPCTPQGCRYWIPGFSSHWQKTLINECGDFGLTSVEILSPFNTVHYEV